MKSDRRRRYHRGRNRKKNHIGILIAAVAVIIAGTAGATLAYLSHQSGLTNQFQIAEVSTTVNEEFDGETKSDVKIKNTGDVPAYIRAAVIIGWQDEEGNALIDEAAPEVNKDYTIAWNLNGTGSNGQWIKGSDGYYYYTSPVDGNAETDILIQECKDIKLGEHKNAGKYLVVDIAAQSIQATPAAAVKEAWGPDKGAVTDVTDDGTLEIQEAQAGGGA